MKKLVSLLLAVVTFSAVSAQQDGKSTDYFKGEKISGIICDGAMNIQLSEDPSATGVFANFPEGTEITIDKTNEDYVRIKFGNDFNRAFKSKITIRVVVSSLKYMQLSGATSVICKGKFMRANNVSISMDGSSASADYLDIVAKDIKIDLAGTTKMEEATINTDNISISTCSTGPKITIVGGKASTGKVVTSGGGCTSINMINFPIAKLEAILTGLSVVKANVQTQANVKTTGSATFRYMGLGVVEGEGNIKPL